MLVVKSLHVESTIQFKILAVQNYRSLSDSERMNTLEKINFHKLYKTRPDKDASLTKSLTVLTTKDVGYI